jgi:nicotinate-nucleotide adenylyltransferase
MRVALFGGSFDPPHRGHVAIARAAADQFSLDTVLFAPAGRQPLKPAGAGASFEDRLAMVALACAEDHSRFAPSALDAPLPDGQPNFTVDTLARLAAQQPGAQIFNLVGADSFRDLPRWRQPERLLELAEWIVVSRPGFPLADPAASLPDLALTDALRSRVHLLGSVHEDVSATLLRQRLHAGDPCSDLLPEGVSAYIRQHHLYLAGTGWPRETA